nr:nuclear pore complex protein NUP214 isoform X1 [Tanacetum cinerariifolium]
MAETETKTVIKISTEIEGDRGGTVNYRFVRLGEPVPVTSDKKFSFDLESLPSRPFALSERCGAVFVAHLNGENTNYVIRNLIRLNLGLFVVIVVDVVRELIDLGEL